MYFAIVALTMFVLPIGSVFAEHLVRADASLVFLTGKWFVFWSVGVRLALAGVRQVSQPEFTARQIFHMSGDETLPIVRELGIANLAAAAVGLASLLAPSFVTPSAVSGAIFFGTAGIRHAMETGRSANETIAMVSDLFVGVVLTGFVVMSFARS